MGSRGKSTGFFFHLIGFFSKDFFFLLLCENAQQMRYVITKLGNEK